MEDVEYKYKYPHPAVTTDCVIFGFDGQRLHVLLIERANDPYKGCWAFPGGFVNIDEACEDGAARELQEETGLTNARLHQFHAFSDPNRDTRERVITVAYYAIMHKREVKGADDAAQARWFALDEVPPLAFDHDEMLREALRGMRQQLTAYPIAQGVLSEEFALDEQRALCETVLGMPAEKKQYDFDEIIPRKGTSCVKHDGMLRDFGSNDLLPMWVADMDFRSPDFVMEALRGRCQHEVLGYAIASDSYYETMQGWFAGHYHIQAERRELHYIPGIVAGIAFVLQAFTRPGDKILVMNPVYPPFLHLPESDGRVLSCSRLKIENGRFAIDFEDLDRKAEGCKLMILSNPHNPGGTVWSKQYLQQVADICERHHVLVIADEIHADMTLPGYRHTSYSTVSETAKNHSFTFIAPSKTFNIAGLGSSVVYVPNEELRRQLFHYLDGYEVANGNIFAYVGAEAAFRYGEDWLRQLREYLAGNVACLQSHLRHYMPQVNAILPEASYLAWLDFSAYGWSHEQTKAMLIDEAKVALNDGTTFGGDAYRNCFRLNIGCPRATLEQALYQIEQCVAKH